MFRFWRFEMVSRSGFQTAASMFTLLSLLLSNAEAAVTLTPDAGYEGPDRQIFTFNPFTPVGDPPLPPSIGQRGVANTRHFQQTFQNPTTFNVGKIVLSMDNASTAFGLALQFYEVADVNSSSWSPLGAPIKTIVIPNITTTPLSTESLGFTLTGGDVFTLPARSAGTTGYGIDIATAFSNTSDGGSALMNYHTTPASDVFPMGRWYRETGPDGSRDIGLALFASNEVPCDPGDTDCDMDVDADDLAAIASHFRQAGGRNLGDLTGNGIIDFEDFGEWKQYYTGPPLPLSAYSFTSVPEPSCVVLLIGGLFGTLSLSARRRGRAMNALQ